MLIVFLKIITPLSDNYIMKQLCEVNVFISP